MSAPPPLPALLRRTGTRMAAAGVFAFLLAVYLATSSFRVDTIDTAIRVEVARSLAATGRPAVRQIDIPTEYGHVGSFAGRGGNFYSVYGLGQSLLMAPFMIADDSLARKLVTLVNPLITAAACVFVLLLGLRLGYSRRATTRAALLTGLCTLAWPHAKLTFEAPIEMGCLVGALYFALGERRRELVASGALLGFAFLTRPSAVVMIPGLALVLLLRPHGVRRAIGLVSVGAAPLVGLALAYNWLRWGGPLASGYSLTQHDYLSPSLQGYYGILLSPGRGFFWFSPILIAALFGWRRLRARHRAVGWALPVLALGYVGLVGATTVWHGDWTWGPRHLLALVPVLALGLLPVLEQPRLVRRLIAPLAIVSIVVQLAGVTVSYDAYRVWVARHGERSLVAHHLRPERSQIVGHLSLAPGLLASSVAAVDACRSDGCDDPYASILVSRPRDRIRPPPTIRAMPDLWWFYFPASGVPTALTILLAAFVLALLAAGLALLRRAARVVDDASPG